MGTVIVGNPRIWQIKQEMRRQEMDEQKQGENMKTILDEIGIDLNNTPEYYLFEDNDILSKDKYVFLADVLKDKYVKLEDVLNKAYLQAAEGKGKERHANENNFEDQPIITISKLLNSNDGPLFQAMKKIQESKRLERDRAINELLGAINYIAAAIIYLEQEK